MDGKHDLSMELYKSVLSTQSAYGRWIFNVLWLVHSGALAGLIAAKATGKLGDHTNWNALGPFVLGIVFAIAASFAMWWSFSYAVKEVHEAIRQDRWPEWSNKSMWTYNVAALFGIVSLLCLAGGSYLVADTWF